MSYLYEIYETILAGKMELRQLALSFLFVVMIIPPLEAAELYVDQNNPLASDNNPGTEASPWKTLKKATDNAVAGDTVVVKAGVYTDTDLGPSYIPGSFQLANSGTSGNPITFISSPPLAATVLAQPQPANRESSRPAAWVIYGKQYITIDGFKIRGQLRFNGCSNVIVQNNEVTEGGSTGDRSLLWGIDIESTSDSLVRNNYVHSLFDNGYLSHNSAAIMVNAFSDDNIIENNTTNLNGSSVWAGYGTKGGKGHRNTWRYNLSIGGATGHFIISSTNDQLSPVGNKIHNNIIINSRAAVTWDNHIFEGQTYNNTAYNVRYFFEAANASVQNMEVWNNISVSTERGLVDWGGYTQSGFPVSGFDLLFDYSDYNNITGSSSHYAYRVAQYPNAVYSSLSQWQNGTNFGDNSKQADPGFVNPGGLDPEGYKRLSYPNDGRGGIYSDVMGAYITGNEVIGYRSGGSSSLPSIAPPDPPQIIQQ